MKKSFKNKSAFTLAEMLIALTVLGIIGSILISFLDVILPDKNLAKFRKAYNTLHQTVQYLTNDAQIYPDGTFDKKAGDVNATSSDFCINFSNQLSTSTAINCASSAAATTASNTYDVAITSTFDGYCNSVKREKSGTNRYAFKTSDDIAWYGMNYDFQSNKDTHYMVICVDTNPQDTTDLAHIYSFGVRYDGKITLGAHAQNDLYEPED